MIKEKIDILNSLEVIESEGGDYCFAFIEDNQENRKKLELIGYDDEKLKEFISKDCIDIFPIAFEVGALYHTGSKFILTKDELFEDLKNAVDEYWECVNRNPLGINEATKKIIETASCCVDVIKDLKNHEQ